MIEAKVTAVVGALGRSIPKFPSITSLLRSNTPFRLDASNISTSWVESANADLSTGTPPATMVASDGDSVGTIYCMGFGGKHFRSAGNTNRPVWKNQSGICYWQWTGSTVVMSDPSTFMRDFTRPIHQVTPSFRIGMLLRIDTDSLAKVIFASKTSTSTAAGIDITHNTTGKFFIRSANGTSLMVNVTATTNGKTVSDGWFYLFFDQQGTAARFGLDSMASPQSMTAANAGADVISSQGLQIGSPGMSIAKIVVENGIWTTNDVNAFKAESTTVNSDPWASQSYVYDYHDGAFLDTACTSPATSSADQIRGLKNLAVSPFGTISSTDGTTASGAASPVVELNSVNGRRAGLYNGDGVRKVTYGRPISPSLCGLEWYGYAFKNLTNATGSHTFVGSSYQGFSGPGYLAGAFPYSYRFEHCSGAPVPNSSAHPLKSNALAYNTIVDIRQGGRHIVVNGSYSVLDETMAAIFRGVETGTSAQGPTWNTNGPFARLVGGTGYFGSSVINYGKGIMQDLNALLAL